MITLSDQRWARLAAAGALVAALALSACGRKGPLDPPPSAAAPTQYSGQPVQPAPLGTPADAAQLAPPPRQPGVGSDGKAVAPPPSGQNRPFILDWLVE